MSTECFLFLFEFVTFLQCIDFILFCSQTASKLKMAWRTQSSSSTTNHAADDLSPSTIHTPTTRMSACLKSEGTNNIRPSTMHTQTTRTLACYSACTNGKHAVNLLSSILLGKQDLLHLYSQIGVYLFSQTTNRCTLIFTDKHMYLFSQTDKQVYMYLFSQTDRCTYFHRQVGQQVTWSKTKSIAVKVSLWFHQSCDQVAHGCLLTIQLFRFSFN